MRFRRMLFRSFQDMNIGLKIALMGCSVLFLAVVVVFSLNMVANRKTSYAFVREVAEEKNKIVTQSIEEKLNNAQDMSALILYNNSVQNYLPLEDTRQQLETSYSLKNIIHYVQENSMGISNIVLCRDNGDVIASNYVNMANMNELEFQITYESMKDAGIGVIWQGMHDIDYHIFPDERFAVTLYRNVISIYTGERIGMMVININEPNILECYEAELNKDTQILIVDENGIVVSSREQNLIYHTLDELGSVRGDRFINTEGQEFLISYAPVKQMNWTLVRLDRYDAVMESSANSNRINMIVCIGVLVITVLIIFWCTRRMMAPLLQLSKVMDSPEEWVWLRQKIDNKCNDEIGRLTRSFSNMQRRIGVLIERIRFEQEQKSRMEILALQTQIKPHFLYNTLESVCALVQLGRNEDAIDMLKSIENFYRGSLSRGAYQITIREEIEITRQYVAIQTYRYFGNLKVEYYISETILDCLVPKLTLQPFLENAIYHGLKNGGRDGLIEIRERHDDKNIILSISDNGEGFDTSVPRKPTANGRGYGISNIHSSIKSFFGAEYGVSIKSAPGEGTTVFIRLPIRRRNTEEVRSI